MHTSNHGLSRPPVTDVLTPPLVEAVDLEKAHSPRSVHSAEQTTDEPDGSLEDKSDRSQDASQQELQRVVSRKELLVYVEKSRRRGLCARFALIPEVTNPYHYSNKTKWLITAIVAVAAAAAPVGSAIILPTLAQVSKEFHTSPTVTNLSVALYMLSMSIFPLWWSAFSETSGRRSIYIISFALFIVFGILSAVSRNIWMLIVMRVLNGGASASVQAVGAGTVADVWETGERGRAMGIFYLGPLAGPLLAPILGGILGQAFSWRATQWALAIYGLLIWILLFLALPETLRSTKKLILTVAADDDHRAGDAERPPLTRTSTRQSAKVATKKYATILRIYFWDPLTVLVYLKYPPVLLTVYYASVTFGSLYILNISIQYTFERPPYSFSTIIIGLLYIPNSVGYVAASLAGGRWMDNIMAREARKRQEDKTQPLVFLPEDRMRENAWLGAIIYPLALLCYGWTVEKGVSWFVPVRFQFSCSE